MNTKYFSLDELVRMMDEPYGSICLKILHSYKAEFSNSPGSSNNHQAWKGGYLDHVVECMNLAYQYHNLLTSLRPLSFTLSDALIVLFLHDIEKPILYCKCDPAAAAGVSKPERQLIKEQVIANYRIPLTLTQKNALKYVEGENYDYSKTERVMNSLAAFCHLADITSARIWYDYPKESQDRPWCHVQRHTAKE